MSIESTKRLVQSGFGIWLASLASVAMAVVACVIWFDRPIALLAYEWFGRHRAVQHLAGTPGFFGPLVVLAFAVLLVRWFLARRFGTIDIVANLCIIALAIAEPLKGWLKFVFGRTWPAYGQPSFIFEAAYGFHPFHGGPDFESFPSGHSAAVCAIAVILWTYLPMHQGVLRGNRGSDLDRFGRRRFPLSKRRHCWRIRWHIPLRPGCACMGTLDTTRLDAPLQSPAWARRFCGDRVRAWIWSRALTSSLSETVRARFLARAPRLNCEWGVSPL